MAAISSISNGEALSSVRTKLNSVITEINLLDPTDWVDYSATSTIVGWSSFTTKVLKYRVIGKQVFVLFQIIGQSNSVSSTFTLPFLNLSNNGELSFFSLAVNNGALTNAAAYSYMLGNSNVVELGTSSISQTWTASGTKYSRGQFFYEIA
jgi:hypothetical protein